MSWARRWKWLAKRQRDWFHIRLELAREEAKGWQNNWLRTLEQFARARRAAYAWKGLAKELRKVALARKRVIKADRGRIQILEEAILKQGIELDYERIQNSVKTVRLIDLEMELSQWKTKNG